MLNKLPIEDFIVSFFKLQGFEKKMERSLVPHFSLEKDTEDGGYSINIEIDKNALLYNNGFEYCENSTFDLSVNCRIQSKKFFLSILVFKNVPYDINKINHRAIEKALALIDKLRNDKIMPILTEFSYEGIEGYRSLQIRDLNC